MKIIYLVRVSSHHGMGGHYHSLKATAEAMNTVYDCVIISIGKYSSPVIQSSNIKSYSIYCNGFNILSTFWKVTNICKQEGADILHSFDIGAYLFGRVTSTILKLPHLLTKCGGPNPGKFYPKFNTIICYSQENITAFKAQKKFLNSNIYYIPNRTDEFDSDASIIMELEKKYRTSNELIFLRIARIGKSYEKGFYKSIQLIELLKRNNIQSKLIIVGAIENEDIYQKLMNDQDRFILLTDKKYTNNAKKIIEFADCIIATGRGVMEAASKKKIIFVPSDNTEFPILLNKDNFTTLLNKNFSPRTVIEIDQQKEIKKIKSLINDIEDRSKYDKFIYVKYNELFNINTAIKKYMTIYQNEKFVQEYAIVDFFKHFVRVMRAFLIRRY